MQNGLYGDFEFEETIRVRINDLKRNAQVQIRALTDLDDLDLTKEEKEVLEKWRNQWDTDLNRICKAIEKE